MVARYGFVLEADIVAGQSSERDAVWPDFVNANHAARTLEDLNTWEVGPARWNRHLAWRQAGTHCGQHHGRSWAGRNQALLEGANRARKFTGVRVAVLRVFLQAAQDNRVKFLGEFWTHAARWARLTVEVMADGLLERFGIEGSQSGGEFVEDNSECVNVAASIDVDALPLFGRNVGGCARAQALGG